MAVLCGISWSNSLAILFHCSRATVESQIFSQGGIFLSHFLERVINLTDLSKKETVMM